MTGTDFSDLLAETREFRDKRSWRKYHNPKDLSVSVMLEAAELLEHFQWKPGEDSLEYALDHKEEISGEIADVFLYLIALSDVLAIDLISAAKRKIDINEKKYPVKDA